MKMIDQISYNLKDGQDNIIDVAEATGLPLLGMVKSSRPVDGHLKWTKDDKCKCKVFEY